MLCSQVVPRPLYKRGFDYLHTVDACLDGHGNLQTILGISAITLDRYATMFP
jgi:hypothetical protein